MPVLRPNEQDFISKLYKELFRQFFSYTCVILQDESVAEEIVQDTFKLACEKIDKIMASKNPQGWLFYTLQHVIERAKRDKQKMARYIVQCPADFNFDSLADDILTEENVDILYSDLTGQQAFELLKKYALEKKSIKEIAEEEGISIEACKQKLYRARIKLRKIFEKQKI